MTAHYRRPVQTAHSLQVALSHGYAVRRNESSERRANTVRAARPEGIHEA